MEGYLEEFHCRKEVFNQFRASKFIKKASKAFKMQYTLHKQEEWKSDPASNSLSVPATHRHVDEGQWQIMSKIPQHSLDELDLNFVQMHLLNHFSDHISQLGSMFNATSKLAPRAMTNQKQVYRRSNCDEGAFKMMQRYPKSRCFRIASWMQNIENILLMTK